MRAVAGLSVYTVRGIKSNAGAVSEKRSARPSPAEPRWLVGGPDSKRAPAGPGTSWACVRTKANQLQEVPWVLRRATRRVAGAGVPGGVRYGYGGRSARGEKFLAIFSVNHCILALKVMPYR